MAKKQKATTSKPARKTIDIRNARIRDLTPRATDVKGGGFNGGFHGGFGGKKST
jgi:hypothetical protein